MRNRLFRLTTSLSLLVVSHVGCILNIGGGSVADVRVTWSFAGVQRCAAVGIEEVTIQLVDKDNEGDPNVPAFGIAAPCVQGSALIAGVVAGEYRVVVTANGPTAAWDNGGGADFTVSAGSENAIAADLVASAVNATIPFRFLDGRRCGEAGVVTVEGQLLDAEGVVVASGDTACDDGVLELPLVPPGTWALRLEGVSADGARRFSRNVPNVEITGVDDRLPTVVLDEATADVLVRFTLPAGVTCANPAIDNVAIRVIDGTGAQDAAIVPCAAGEAVLRAGNLGDATVAVEALVNGAPVMDGSATLTVVPGGNVSEVRLRPRLSTVTLSWDFTTVVDDNPLDGTPAVESQTGSCAAANVDTINVRFLQAGLLVAAVTVGCTAAIVDVPAVPLGITSLEIEGIRTTLVNEIETPVVLFDAVYSVTVDRLEHNVAVNLRPATITALVVWTADCGVAGASTVDVQVATPNLATGTNVPCANSQAFLTLPPGSAGTTTVRLRGVDGQGVPLSTAQVASGVLQDGLAIFRFDGPL